MGDDAADPDLTADPAMMEKLMAAMGKGGGEGGEGGEGGGMDMAALQAMLGGMGGGGMGGMGGGPEADAQATARQNQQAAASKNDGEKDGENHKWEQTSKYGESEIIVRFPLATPATKKDVKVVFKAKQLVVTVAGEELMNGKTFAAISTDDSTWCLAEKGAELQLLLALAEDTKWDSLILE